MLALLAAQLFALSFLAVVALYGRYDVLAVLVVAGLVQAAGGYLAFTAIIDYMLGG